jgi:hypothetical protein
MPLFCEEELTVSNLLRKDRIALVNLTLILSSLQFYPCFGKKMDDTLTHFSIFWHILHQILTKNGQHFDKFFHTLTYIASDFDKKMDSTKTHMLPDHTILTYTDHKSSNLTTRSHLGYKSSRLQHNTFQHVLTCTYNITVNKSTRELIES